MLAAILIVVGLLKPDLSNFINNFTPSNNVVNVVVEKPTNTEILDECQGVIDALKEDSDRKQDGPRLASLYNDLAGKFRWRRSCVKKYRRNSSSE